MCPQNVLPNQKFLRVSDSTKMLSKFQEQNVLRLKQKCLKETKFWEQSILRLKSVNLSFEQKVMKQVFKSKMFFVGVLNFKK